MAIHPDQRTFHQKLRSLSCVHPQTIVWLFMVDLEQWLFMSILVLFYCEYGSSVFIRSFDFYFFRTICTHKETEHISFLSGVMAVSAHGVSTCKVFFVQMIVYLKAFGSCSPR